MRSEHSQDKIDEKWPDAPTWYLDRRDRQFEFEDRGQRDANLRFKLRLSKLETTSASTPFSLPTLGLSVVFRSIQIQIVMSRLKPPTKNITVSFMRYAM